MNVGGQECGGVPKAGLLAEHWDAEKPNFCLAWIKGPDGGGERLFADQGNGLGVGDCLPSIGLAKAFLDFRQETEPFDRILKRGGIRKPFHNLKNLLLDRFSGHCDHLIRFIL